MQQMLCCHAAWGCFGVAVCAADHIMLSYCLRFSCSGFVCSRSHYVVILLEVVLQWVCLQQITLCCHTAWGCLIVGVHATGCLVVGSMHASDHIMLSYCLGLSYSGCACSRSHYVVIYILPEGVLHAADHIMLSYIYYLRVSCSGHVCSRSHYVVILPKIVLQWVCMQQITLCCHTAQGGLVEGMCAADHIMFSYCQSDWGRVVTDMF